MRTAQRGKPLGQVAGHLRRRRRARGNCGECSCDGEQVLDPVPHFAREHLAGFLGQLALSHVEKDPEHHPPDDTLVIALPRAETQRTSPPCRMRKSIS